MCNRLHDNSKPTPKCGYGYKLFQRFTYTEGVFSPLYGSENIYHADKRGWVKWKIGFSTDFFPGSFGFCFFRSSKTAMRVLNYYGNDRDIVMKRIQYRRGLGHHIETKMIGGMRIPIALCKEFKILEERPNDKTRI